MERRYLAREDEPEIVVARSEGSCLFDARGRRYVDFVMGWCVGNFGWGNAALARHADRYRGPDYVYPGYAYGPWGELAKLLASLSPGRLTRCFRATGGSEAVDLALQAAMVHTGRRAFMSLEDSYHGNTIAAMSVGASEYREKAKNLLPHCHKISPPLDARALARIERRLQKRDVAAFIMEPISINLGVLIPERPFMRALQRLCRRHGTLLIMDEVATGFGRTGTIFASEQFGISPDMMCVAKAITGGLGGLGAMIATPAVAKSMEEDGNFYSTYGWHPRSVNVAIATLRYLVDHEKRLLGHVARMSELFGRRLAAMRFESEPELRVRGLAIGVDVGDADYAGRIKERCRRGGLLITKEDTTLLLLPALNVERRIAEEGLDILERSV
jgi:acetylornithine/succinyldiaminopimelate/putrescine aminotransferase